MALIDFAGSPHGGKQKLLPEWQSQAVITPVLIIDHSIVGSASGAYYYFRDSTGLESHFIVCGKPSGSIDGQIWQLMDTGRRADANSEANNKAISIETEDNGDPNNYPWSPAQLESLKWLHNTLVRYHPTIKRLEAKDCDGPGLGYHSKMGAPSCWTPSAGKTCPGKPVRVDQWRNVLLPAFLSGEEDMALSQADKEWIVAKFEQFIGIHRLGDGSDAPDSVLGRIDRAVLRIGGGTNASYTTEVFPNMVHAADLDVPHKP
jgi:hypothetical protein